MRTSDDFRHPRAMSFAGGRSNDFRRRRRRRIPPGFESLTPFDQGHRGSFVVSRGGAVGCAGTAFVVDRGGCESILRQRRFKFRRHHNNAPPHACLDDDGYLYIHKMITA